MGLLSDAARGRLDYVHADDENLSDSRAWHFPKKNIAISKTRIADEIDEKEEAKTPQEAQDVSDADYEEE